MKTLLSFNNNKKKPLCLVPKKKNDSLWCWFEYTDISPPLHVEYKLISLF